MLRVMSRALTHRGPDDRGMLIDRELAIAARRLSIIDVALGHQPVYGEDGLVAAVLNGEIYNAAELRAQLAHNGHRFVSRCDTEVVVHAYEEWGEASVTELRGMFALAVWDGRTAPPQLLLARDRLGIKPLYYCAQEARFAFASEVRALLRAGMAAPRLSRTGLESYLAFGSVQEPVTLVAGVQSLPAGHLLHVRGSTRTLRRYWDLPEQHETRAAATIGDTPRRVAELLEDAVHRQLASDTEVGVFLSGGMDSTALIAIASELRTPIHSFTVRFAERAFDEGAAAQRAAARWGSAHREVTVAASDVQAELPRYLRAMDQPSMDGINTYFVARAAAESRVPVVLSGLGGDETFGGYALFEELAALARARAALAPPRALDAGRRCAPARRRRPR
ncbi:MAG: asparagine synthase (glutamine-hydrolyzing) [Planctomycetota bacterium]